MRACCRSGKLGNKLVTHVPGSLFGISSLRSEQHVNVVFAVAITAAAAAAALHHDVFVPLLLLSLLSSFVRACFFAGLLDLIMRVPD